MSEQKMSERLKEISEHMYDEKLYAWSDEIESASKIIEGLESKLAKIEDYINFKTSTFPRSKSVDSEYALVLDKREVKAWFEGLHAIHNP